MPQAKEVAMDTSLRTLTKLHRTWRQRARLSMLTGLAALAAVAWACFPYAYYDDPYYYYSPYSYYYTYGYYDAYGYWHPYYLKSASEGSDGVGKQIGAVTAPPQAGVDDLAEARARVDLLNTYVRHALLPVEVLVKQKPSSQTDNQHVYGPIDYPDDNPSATFRLTGRKLAEDRYGWRLDAKPIGADDGQYKPVMAGHQEKVVEARQGNGVLGFHLDNLHAVNPTAYEATGKLIAASAAAPNEGKALLFRLIDFKPTAQASPLNAVWAGDRDVSGASHLRMVTRANRIQGEPDMGEEQVARHLTWVRDTGGRLYVLLSQGDIPEGGFWLGQSCYDKGGALLYKGWHYCEGTTAAACLGMEPTVLETPGHTPMQCPAGTDAAPPASIDPGSGPTPTAPAQPPSLPETPPADIPAS